MVRLGSRGTVQARHGSDHASAFVGAGKAWLDGVLAVDGARQAGLVEVSAKDSHGRQGSTSPSE